MLRLKSDFPADALRTLPVHLRSRANRAKIKQVSDGWHEGYMVQLPHAGAGARAGAGFGEEVKFFLRIWRNQLGYFRLTHPTTRAVVLKAIALAEEAGVRTASLLTSARQGSSATAGSACDSATIGAALGECQRADGDIAEFCCFNWIEHRARPRSKTARLPLALRTRIILQQMFLRKSVSLC